LKKLSGFFYQISNGWIALAGLLLFLVFSGLTLPIQWAHTSVYAHGLGIPDTNLFYTSKAIIHMAEVYGAQGRATYIQDRWTYDLAYPFIYTFFLITSISFLFKKGAKEGNRLPMFNLIPFAALLMDLGENASASAVMAAFPLPNAVGQFMAPIFTPLKWLFFSFSILLVLIGLTRWVSSSIARHK
jgi:hypothetical protein